MKKIVKNLTIGLALVSSLGFAQDGHWKVGVESFGASIKYDISHKDTLQFLGGTWGGYGTSSFGARYLHKFKQKKNYNIYGFGGILYGSDEYSYAGVTSDASSLGFQGGVGLEYSLSKFIDLPLYWDIEVGYTSLSYDFEVRSAYGSANHSVDVGGFHFAGGLHYKF